MSTIKSSAENLTLNADGANNDIKFQSNGVEKASIDQDGKITAGGASLDGAVTINDTGADVDFRVESDTDANALFVQGSSGKVGFGLEPTMGQVNIKTTGTFTTAYTDANGTGISMYSTDTAGDGKYGAAITWGALGGVNSHQAAISSVQTGSDANQVGLSMFTHNSTTGSAAMTEQFRITHDGRGVSQFTAAFWARVNMEGTFSITGSHNISSVTDRGVGKGTLTFANNLSNANYCVVGSAFSGGGENDQREFQHSNETTWSTSAWDWCTMDELETNNDITGANMVGFGG